MTSAFTLLAIILTAYVCVLVGSIAYELTGLDRETARFQALSAFTNCGFTTQAAEAVVEHAARRKITMTLMILGYAGLASVISTLIRSVEVDSLGGSALTLMAMTILAGLGFWFIFRTRWGENITDGIRRFLAWRMARQWVPHEDLQHYKHGYGLVRIEIPEHSRVEGRQLRELDLRERHLQILAIEEDDEVDPIPHPDVVLKAGQHLIVYGRLKAVQDAFSPKLAWRNVSK
ncbi:MAG: TrkA C-terminal domain-containing protein [Alphaproteobacteria bacterium]|nr:TrkA C-terminal domain-containing protein [Alphaproteobacteria bacterium]